MEEQLESLFTILKLLNYQVHKLTMMKKDYYTLNNKIKHFVLSIDNESIILFHTHDNQEIELSENIKNYKIIFDKLTSLL